MSENKQYKNEYKVQAVKLAKRPCGRSLSVMSDTVSSLTSKPEMSF